MNDSTPPGSELLEGIADDLALLRAAHPSFVSVADILVDLAADGSVSPQVYDRVCEAVFTVLTAWAMKDAVRD